MKSWCDKIEEYVKTDPSVGPLDPGLDQTPEEEIENWSKRLLTLISITEQLKTKQNRVVTGVLKVRALKTEPDDSKQEEAALKEQEQVKALIERWRDVDLQITDALNEAKASKRATALSQGLIAFR